MANYKKEEKYAFSDKGKNAFEQFNAGKEEEKKENKKEEKKEEKKETKKETKNTQKAKNVKANKKNEKECKKKCKKKGKIIKIITGTALVAALAAGGIKIGYGYLQDKQEKEFTEKINNWIDNRQSDLDDIVTKGSSADALFAGNYKDLYEEYSRLYKVANYTDKFEKLNIEHDIIERNNAQELCIDCNAANFEEQCETLLESYWKLKNTRASQTPGTDEYKEFQIICNTMANTRDNASNILNSNEVRGMLFNMYSVCLVGDYCDNNRDKNDKPFDASKIYDIDIQQNSDHTGFNLVFSYDGYQYIKSGVPVAEIMDLVYTTPDVLSGFGTINSILIGDKNLQSSNEVLYENDSVRVMRG